MTQLWRLIRTGIFNAFENMAIDHLLLDACHKDTAANTLRFYRWKPSAVSVGRFQHMDDEVDVDACRVLNVDLVRRMSSGGAVYHDFEGELTYSIICRMDDDQLTSDVVETYQHLCSGLLKGLNRLGVLAKFSSGSENFCPNLFVKKRKISGNAQSRRGNTLLQHGTILRSLDLNKMFSVLKVNKNKVDSEAIQKFSHHLTSLEEELGKSPTFGQIEEALIEGLGSSLPARFYEEGLTDAELQSARKIAQSWYNKPEWTFQRGF
ncbi:MAG: biotin/lipoate A/B protein ligase family protein [Candidatus Thorarchaeota archaeon]